MSFATFPHVFTYNVFTYRISLCFLLTGNLRNFPTVRVTDVVSLLYSLGISRTFEEYTMKRESVLTLMLAILTALVFVWRQCGSYEEHKPLAVSQQSGFVITADDLYSAYVDNSVAADERFKGKVLVISGTVQGVAKYGKGSAVNLLTSNRRGVIQCYFEENQNQAVAKLTGGQHAAIKGRCDRFFEDTVLVYECVMQ